MPHEILPWYICVGSNLLPLFNYSTRKDIGQTVRVPCGHGAIRTHTDAGLSRSPLPIGIRGQVSQDGRENHPGTILLYQPVWLVSTLSAYTDLAVPSQRHSPDNKRECHAFVMAACLPPREPHSIPPGHLDALRYHTAFA